MEEPLLLKISLSFSLVGIIILFLLADSIEIGQTGIANLTEIEENQVVRLRGVVTYVQDNGKTLNLELAQPEAVEVFVFKSSNLSIKKGDFLDIVGEVREYRGRKELLANQINVLD
jgi:DNA/RNA endonuclease YhcR with UshA esterase domain